MRRLFARLFTKERLRFSLFGAAALLATITGLALYFPDPLHFLELKTVDARFSIRGKDKPPSNLVVVAVTDDTFGLLGFHWPFAYRVHAKTINNIYRDHPKAIAIDIQWSEHSALGPNDDQALAEALYNTYSRAVVSTTVLGPKGQVPFIGNYSNLHDLQIRAGFGQFPNDEDGAIRRMNYRTLGLKTLGVATTEVATGHKVKAPPSNDPYIDFYGPPGTIPTVDFASVYRGRLPKGYFHNKIVVLGASASSLQDVHETSVSQGQLMSGPEIQANAVGTAMRGFPLQRVSGIINVLLIVLMAIVAPLASIRLSLKLTLAVLIVAALALVFGTQLAFNSGSVVTFIYPVIALVVSAVGTLGGHYVLRAFEGVRVRDLFSRFVPANVVDQVIQRTDSDLRLGGVRREGTVMFTDLRGFTSFSERLEPERVVEVINQYLGGMTEAILNHGGTLVSFMGDGIMALWGAPLEQPDHADRALRAAREMLSERLPAFNAWLADQGYDHSFRMGIGLNSGPVMSGQVGSERRLEYTALGDTTNTASRLEGMTKGTPHQMFISDSTRASLQTESGDLVYVDEFEIRGRTTKLKLWTLAEPAAPPRPEAAATTPA